MTRPISRVRVRVALTTATRKDVVRSWGRATTRAVVSRAKLSKYLRLSVGTKNLCSARSPRVPRPQTGQ